MAKSYDLVLRGGRVVDGTGSPARTADVALRGDTIADVGAINPTDETPLLEATGLTVAPGFVDAWAAVDPLAPLFPQAESKLLQGVTTEVAGAGARWPFPLAEGEDLDLAGAENDLMAADWADARGFLLRISRAGSAVNRAFFAGYGRIRESVIGPSDAPPTRDETRRVAKELESVLEAGCLGLSADLARPPAEFAGPEEIVELARVLAEAGGVLALGLRDTGAGLEAAVDEALEVASRTGVELLLPALGIGPVPYWDKIDWLEARLRKAIDSGAGLSATVEPYVARVATLSSILPPSRRGRGAGPLAERVTSTTGREEVARALSARAEEDEGYWGRISLLEQGVESKGAVQRCLALADMASRQKRPPVEVLLDLAAEDPEREALLFELSESNVARILGWEFVAVGSGEPARPVDDPRVPSPSHPRGRGAFARILRRYVREKKVLSLEEAVRRMTSLPAKALRLGLRGRIAAGCAADIVLFRADTVVDQATFNDPQRQPVGIDHVIVGGRFAVRDGKPTGARAGEIIRRS
ncbi:MAG: N-acyl-D-amino-acid deacylase family protein [Planctomycetota bacterium]|jgi:N-acyl-D-aspartate/D-glutamate deacylase